MKTGWIIVAAVVVLAFSAPASSAEGAAAAASTGSGHAYPARPVRLIAPYPPGGGNDTMARAIGAKLSSEIARALDTAGMKEQLDRQGVEPRSMKPAEFRAFMEAELARWGKVVRDSGARAE